MTPQRRVCRLLVERLETRCLLSGSAVPSALVIHSDGEDGTTAMAAQPTGTKGDDSLQGSDDSAENESDGTAAHSSADRESDGGDDGSARRTAGSDDSQPPAQPASSGGTSEGIKSKSDGNSDGTTPASSNTSEDPTTTTQSADATEDSGSTNTATDSGSTSSSSSNSSLPPPVQNGAGSSGSPVQASHTTAGTVSTQSVSAADTSDQPTSGQKAAEENPESPVVASSASATEARIQVTSNPGRADAMSSAAAPTNGTEDRSLAALNGPGQSPPSSNLLHLGPVLQAAPVFAQQQQRMDGDLKPRAAASQPQTSLDNLGSDAVGMLYADASAAAYPTFLANALPVDLSGLESCIKDFFHQIDELGSTLSENRVDLLVASGTVAVVAAMAVEIARRQLQPVAVPALARGRGRLPYSDYP